MRSPNEPGRVSSRWFCVSGSGRLPVYHAILAAVRHRVFNEVERVMYGENAWRIHEAIMQGVRTAAYTQPEGDRKQKAAR